VRRQGAGSGVGRRDDGCVRGAARGAPRRGGWGGGRGCRVGAALRIAPGRRRQCGRHRGTAHACARAAVGERRGRCRRAACSALPPAPPATRARRPGRRVSAPTETASRSERDRGGGGGSPAQSARRHRRQTATTLAARGGARPRPATPPPHHTCVWPPRRRRRASAGPAAASPARRRPLRPRPPAPKTAASRVRVRPACGTCTMRRSWRAASCRLSKRPRRGSSAKRRYGNGRPRARRRLQGCLLIEDTERRVERGRGSSGKGGCRLHALFP